MENYNLSEQGKRIQKLVEENKEKYQLIFISGSFNLSKSLLDNTLFCKNNCGCFLSIGSHGNGLAIPEDSADSYSNSLFIYYEKLGFSYKYLAGIISGFDSHYEQTNFVNSEEEFIIGYKDGFYFKNLYNPNSRYEQYKLMGLA